MCTATEADVAASPLTILHLSLPFFATVLPFISTSYDMNYILVVVCLCLCKHFSAHSNGYTSIASASLPMLSNGMRINVLFI
ncbi:hypothetical protein M405DRAFT_33021 [Rhizopogon salebrosus TDB-379]|nr:hypothetical protein M405DRAFT_33021 [Rhizopogon salebrosus TDB-379]